jgi:acetyl-CoA acyltransferase
MEAYILTGYRSAVGKAPKGKFRFMRADDLAVTVLRHLVASVPGLEPEMIDDVMAGNATPEAEQGLNIARMIALAGLDTEKVPGVTVNRYCASGLETIAMAAAKIKSGMADCIVAGGVETMSHIPFGGWRIVPNYEWAAQHPDWYWNMGLTAEAVAREYQVSREDQDAFSLQSHQKAVRAIRDGAFREEIVPVQIDEVFLDEQEKKQTRSYVVDTDEGARANTSLEQLAALKPVFSADGTITAGNSSQTSDGAAFVLVAAHHGHRSGGGGAQGPETLGLEGRRRAAHRAQRSVCLPGPGRHPRAGPGSGNGKRQRRRHRFGPSPRLHRRQAHRAIALRNAPPQAPLRLGHHVRGHGPGRRRHF